MNQKKIVAGLLVIFAIFIMSGALSASTSSVSYLIRVLGIGLAVVAFVKPKLGLYIVTAEAFSTDYLKKVAVYFGSPSTYTIIEVMMVVMIALLATYAGRLVQIMFKTGKRTNWEEWGFYLVGIVITIAVFFLSGEGFLEAGQQAFNVGVYIGVGGLIIGLLRDADDLWKFYRFALWFGVAWCLMALKQIYFGYSDLEVFYARTGLSQVATSQFYTSIYENPRPSGFGSGAVNLGAIAVFFAISLWAAMNIGRKYWIIVLLVGATAILSQVKAIAGVVILVALAYPFCKNKTTLGISYVIGIIVLSLGIYFSDDLYHNIAQIDYSFRGFFGLGDSWSIQTFSDRLYGWNELKKASNWSWAPQRENFGSHDEVSSLLQSAGGGVVLLSFLSLCAFLAFFHRAALRSVPGSERNLAAMLSAYVILSIVIGVAIGGFLKGQPQGLVVWFSAGGVFLLGQCGAQRQRELQAQQLLTARERNRSQNSALEPSDVTGALRRI